MIQHYCCAHCGNPLTPEQAALSTACEVCGKPWRRTTARSLVNLPAIRSRAGTALEAGDLEKLTEVVQSDIPAMLSLITELVQAVAALNGECKCKPVRAAGRRLGPCPHYRGGAALLRAGVPPQDVIATRRRIDRTVP